MNIEEFLQARRYAQRLVVWASHQRNTSLSVYTLLLAGRDGEAKEHGESLVRYLLSHDDWTTDVEMMTVMMLMGRYSEIVDVLNHLYVRVKPYTPFIDREYDLRPRINYNLLSIMYDFCKAIVKRDYAVAMKFMNLLLYSTEDPKEIYDKFSFILLAMIKTLVEVGFDCGEPGNTYKAWREWLSKHPPDEKFTLEEERKWIQGARLKAQTTRNSFSPSPSSITPPVPHLSSKREILREPDELLGHPEVEYPEVGYPEDIGFCFTTTSELRAMSLRDHFSEDGVFDDECDVNLTMKDIFGSDAMTGGRVPDTVGDVLSTHELVLLFKTRKSFQEFMRHIAMHNDIFEVDQPGSDVLHAIRKYLPAALSKRILDAISPTDIMRVGFDTQELREGILPAMERVLVDAESQELAGESSNPTSGTRLNSYIVDQLKSLFALTRAVLEKYPDALLLICSEF